MRNPFSGGNERERSKAKIETPAQKVSRANSIKKVGQLSEAGRLYQAAIKELGENHNDVWNVAVNNLGNLILIKGDLKQAKKFYVLAAENGLVNAMFNAGHISELLNEVTEAIYWYKKAANKNHARGTMKYSELAAKQRASEADSRKTSATQSSPKLRVKPSPRLIKTPRDAELVARDWMIYFGFDDAKATRVGSDDGIDVTSSSAIAQVKFKGSKTPRDDIKLLHSSTVRLGKRGMFFSLNDYSKPAIEFANEVRIALFTFDYQGEPKAVNSTARSIVSH